MGAFILFEIFAGEAGQVVASGDKVNEYVKQSFSTMRLIVSVGWSIYPLGYFFGYLMGGVQDSVLNLVYNLADFVNKIAFCLAILDPNDAVAISFWIISISMVAATVFFLMESMAVSSHWKTSMNVGSLVTLVAGVHYFYMREFWVKIGT